VNMSIIVNRFSIASPHICTHRSSHEEDRDEQDDDAQARKRVEFRMYISLTIY